MFPADVPGLKIRSSQEGVRSSPTFGASGMGQPARLTRCRTPRCLAISRNFTRLAAKIRPSKRSPRSLSIPSRYWLARFVPRRKEPSPALDDLEIGPRLHNFGIKPQQNVQMIVQHRETTDGHGEDLRKFLESAFKPLLAVVVSFAEQGRLANTARHAVVLASQRQIDQFRSSDRHGKSPVGYYDILYAMPEDSSRSVDLLVFKNQHRDRSSLVRHGRKAMKCVSFPSCDGRRALGR